VALKEDVKPAMAGDAGALATEPAKEKKSSPLEMVKGLSAPQRKALRARAEEILEALDEACLLPLSRRSPAWGDWVSACAVGESARFGRAATQRRAHPCPFRGWIRGSKRSCSCRF
jgi:hypothetical protein